MIPNGCIEIYSEKGKTSSEFDDFKRNLGPKSR